jgi:thiamine transport system permease protein
VAERDNRRVRPHLVPTLFFLAAFSTPYLLLFVRYSASLRLDGYVLWVFLFTWGQAAASAALSLGVGLALVPAYVKFPWVKPAALVPFFAPAVSTVDALVRLHGDFMYGPWGVVVAHSVYYAPYVALVVESNLRSIPADLLDAADLYVRRIFARARIR